MLYVNLIKRPTLLLDEQKCRANIRFMAEKAKKENVLFRPHFKTHQSRIIGSWFKEYGVRCITVSSLEMAVYFAADWDDITVAFPVNVREIDTINELAASISLTLLLESEESAALLSTGLKYEVSAYLKIDTGYNRTGVIASDLQQMSKIIAFIDASRYISFKGFLTHAGNTYSCRTSEDVIEIASQASEKLRLIKKHFIEKHPQALLSVGDTPSLSLQSDLIGVDEIRPGNFVFYDLMQHAVGACSLSQIAVAVACPVVAIHKERKQLIIYGGAVHFSKEALSLMSEGAIYGQVVEREERGWGKVIPGMNLIKLSQEHGTVEIPDDLLDAYSVGNLIYILPVHSCLTANLMHSYLTLEGSHISMI